MTNARHLDYGLLAGFSLATLAFTGFWRNGTLGGFVVVVGFAATIIWALWVGWRPALAQLHTPDDEPVVGR